MAAPFVEDAFFFPLYNFSFFVKNRVFVGVWINILVFDSIPLVNQSVFMSIPSCFHSCSSVIELDVRDGDASESSFIIQNCFGYPGFLVFLHEIDYCSLKVCDEDRVEFIDCFW